MPTYPPVSHPTLDNTLARRDGTPVSARMFLADMMTLATILPPGGHTFNVCVDRYRFTVGLDAVLVAGKVSLLLSIQMAQTVCQLSTFTPDVFCLHDATACPVDPPAFRYLGALTPGTTPIDVPQIDTS